MTNGSKKVLEFLKSVYPQEMTAQEIVKAINDPEIKIATVTGCVNGLCKKERAVRREDSVENPATGKMETIKYIVLTDVGMAYDPDAEEAQKLAEKAARKAEREAERAARKAENQAQ